MKATGIVRRVDDLGRIVISKEIRRTMRIREGDPLELYTGNDGEIIFKKYQPLGELSQAKELAHGLNGALNRHVIMCSKDAVIWSSDYKLNDQPINNELPDHAKRNHELKIGNDSETGTYYPINVNADLIGGLLILVKDDDDPELINMAVSVTRKSIAHLLSSD